MGQFEVGVHDERASVGVDHTRPSSILTYADRQVVHVKRAGVEDEKSVSGVGSRSDGASADDHGIDAGIDGAEAEIIGAIRPVSSRSGAITDEPTGHATCAAAGPAKVGDWV